MARTGFGLGLVVAILLLFRPGLTVYPVTGTVTLTKASPAWSERLNQPGEAVSTPGTAIGVICHYVQPL